MSSIKDLYTLHITNRRAAVDEWLADYQAFTSDVAKVRAALKEGKEIRSKATYEAISSLKDENDPWPAFAKRVLIKKYNGVASAGQSVLSKENFQRFIREQDFVNALTELIKQPDKENFVKFVEAWERTRKKCRANRNPQLVNRTLAACTTNVTCAPKDVAFESVYQWLVREGFIPQLPEPEAGWYDKNIQVMAFLRKSFAEKLRKGETNEHLLSIFVWQIYQNILNHVSPKKPVPNKIPSSELADCALIADIKKIGSNKATDPTIRNALVNARVGQGKFGLQVRQLWDHRCSVTGSSTKAALEASHIQAWADSNDAQRLDPNNGLLLTANLHKLFDAGLISFEDSGKMLVSSKLSSSEQEIFGVIGRRLCKKPSPETAEYLAYHKASVVFQ